MDVKEDASSSISNFQARLRRFSYEKATSAPHRPSPILREHTVETEGFTVEARKSVTEPPTQSPKKRKADDLSSPKRTQSRRRGYAPPEIYAHLEYLTDCLAENLDGAHTCHFLNDQEHK